jgi:biopolymer transport protein ExbD
VRYERVAIVMAMAQGAGMRKIAFVTDPRIAAPSGP